MPLSRATKVVEACMCLHNVMIDRGVAQEIRPPVYSTSGRVTVRPHIDHNGAPSQLLTGDGAENCGDGSGMRELRAMLTQKMRTLGMKRPQLTNERRRQQEIVNAL